VSAIEIIAVIFAVFILLKVSIVLINPHGWFKLADAILRNTIITTIAYLLIAVIVGYFIFRSFSIVQVAAIMLFSSILIGLGLLPFSETFLTIRDEMLGSRSYILRKTWFTLLIWITIALWTLYEVFSKRMAIFTNPL
jgi:hypothetical protein